MRPPLRPKSLGPNRSAGPRTPRPGRDRGPAMWSGDRGPPFSPDFAGANFACKINPRTRILRGFRDSAIAKSFLRGFCLQPPKGFCGPWTCCTSAASLDPRAFRQTRKEKGRKARLSPDGKKRAFRQTRKETGFARKQRTRKKEPGRKGTSAERKRRGRARAPSWDGMAGLALPRAIPPGGGLVVVVNGLHRKGASLKQATECKGASLKQARAETRARLVVVAVLKGPSLNRASR